MNSPQVIVGSALAVIIALILMTTYTWEIEVEKPYPVIEPYHYEQIFVRETQVPNFPLVWQSVTQTQYLIKNMEDKEGTFTLNFLFDNGVSFSSRTMKINIMSDEQKAVTINSPLTGESKISLNTVPPDNITIQYRPEKKKVNAWYYVPGINFFLK